MPPSYTPILWTTDATQSSASPSSNSFCALTDTTMVERQQHLINTSTKCTCSPIVLLPINSQHQQQPPQHRRMIRICIDCPCQRKLTTTSPSHATTMRARLQCSDIWLNNLLFVAMVLFYLMLASSDMYPRSTTGLVHVVAVAATLEWHYIDAINRNSSKQTPIPIQIQHPQLQDSQQQNTSLSHVAHSSLIQQQQPHMQHMQQHTTSLEFMSSIPDTMVTGSVSHPTAQHNVLVMQGRIFRYGVCGYRSSRKSSSSQALPTSAHSSICPSDSSLTATGSFTSGSISGSSNASRHGRSKDTRQHIPTDDSPIVQQDEQQQGNDIDEDEEDDEEEESDMPRPPPPSASPADVLRQLGSRLATSRLNIGTRQTTLQGISETNVNAYLPRRIFRRIHSSSVHSEGRTGEHMDMDTDDVMPKERSLNFRWKS